MGKGSFFVRRHLHCQRLHPSQPGLAETQGHYLQFTQRLHHHRILHIHVCSKVFRIILLVGSVLFYVFAVIYYLSVEDNSFDSLTASIEAILIVTYSIFYLFDQMNKPQVIFIYQEPNFWFVVAFIIYFSGTLFLFIQASNLDREIRDNFWKINLFLNITKNILFAIAFSTKKSNKLPLSPESPFEHDILENPYKT